jgi:hypothetical protein
LCSLSTHLGALGSVHAGIESMKPAAALATLLRHLARAVPALEARIAAAAVAARSGVLLGARDLIEILCEIDGVAGALRYAAVAARASHGWENQGFRAFFFLIFSFFHFFFGFLCLFFFFFFFFYFFFFFFFFFLPTRPFIDIL